MTDPYQPPLADFVLPQEEQLVVDAALASPHPWDYVPDSDEEVTALKSAKERILNFHLQRHSGTCCYCRTNLNGAGPFMTDREHILPKGKAAYRPYSYTMWNLSVSCKRCNLQFKGRDDTFVIDASDAAKFQSSDNYRLVHPNFDFWDKHLNKLSVQVNAKNLVMIFPNQGCAKAAYTYEFFNLHALEVDSFDQGQGAEVTAPESSAVAELRKLAEQFCQ